ncbi:GPO family capsid scaffolding protein, partial [Klebsiella pneumoniae]|nr:GPO family capsid scaffolding protein [Klebsiella pneumoniae]
RVPVMAFNNQQAEPPMFTEAIEAEVIEMTAQRSDEGAKWYSRVMGIISKGQKTDDQRFSQMHQVVEAVAQSQSEQIDQFNAAELERQQDKAAIQKLTNDLAALRQQLEGTDGNFSQRQPANGGANAQLADY